MATADECKANGNMAFHAKKFADAAEWYGMAIEKDNRNAIFYNNRAAAYLEMNKFAEAAADAEKSSILSPTAKANARHGRALRSLGRKDEAIQAYERALRLDPSNKDYKGALSSLKEGGGAGTAGPKTVPAVGGSVRAFQLDAAIMVAAAVYLPLVLLSPGFAQWAWQIGLIAFIARQLLTLVATTASEQLRTLGFWKTYATTRATAEFGGQYVILCGSFLLTQAGAQQFFFVAMALYAAIDLVTAQRTHLDAIIRGSRFEHLIAPRMQQAVANRQQLFLQAAACEAMSLFTMPLSGCPLVAMLVATQFIKWRYRADPWSQHAWRGLHQQVQQLTRHPRCPAMMSLGFDKFASLLHRAGSS